MATENTQTATFLLPDTITMAHWEAYCDGAASYSAEARRRGKTVNNAVSQFHGVMALIQAGYVHVEGAKGVTDWLTGKNFDNVPLPIVGAVVREVALVIENEINRPLEIWLLKSSNGAPGQSDTASQADSGTTS